MTKHIQVRTLITWQVGLAAIAVLALAGFCFSQSTSDWPQFHYTNMQRWNPYETVLGVNSVGNLELKWSYPIGPTESSPIVANGAVYTGSTSGMLYAFNATTGALLWSYQTASGGMNSASPAIANGVVYFGSIDGLVYALNASTGAKLWSYQTGAEIEGAPTVVDGVVYIGSNDNNVYALNASTGAKLWSYTTGGYVTSTPAVENGMVYASSYDGSVYALNASTGAEVWSYYGGGSYELWDPSPALSNGLVYVEMGTTEMVYALNASTGAEIWSFNIGNGYIPKSSPAVAYGVVYIGSGDGTLYALDASTGAELWNYPTGNIVETSPAVANGVVYFGTNNWVFYAVNASTGALLWSYPTVFSENPSPVVSNGMVYVGDNGGSFYAFGLPSLHLSVAAYPTPPVPGELLTYAFKVWNQSSEDAVHEVLTTQVPAGTTFSSIKLSGTAGLGSCTTPAVGASGPVVCHENSVMKPNSTWTIRMTVQITAPVGTVITETATASSENLGGGSATVQNTVVDYCLRVIPDPIPPLQGAALTYAFEIWNASTVDAVHEVLTTQVPAGTTFSGITISGTPGLGSCTTPAVGGTGPVVCHEGSAMKPNSTWTVRMTVQVTAAIGTVITETATASSDNLGSISATSQNTVH